MGDLELDAASFFLAVRDEIDSMIFEYGFIWIPRIRIVIYPSRYTFNTIYM